MRALDPLLEKARRLPPIAVDGAIAAGIFVIGGLGQLPIPAWGDPWYLLPNSQRLAGFCLLALACLGVALRRTNLWVACVLVVLAALGGLFTWDDQYGNCLPQLALLYTVSERRGLGTSLLALGVSALLPFMSGHHSGAAVFPSDLRQQAEGNWPYLVLVWFAGRAQARRHCVSRELERGLAELNEERERLSLSAVAAERSRIARDLHALVVRGVERMDAETRASRELLGSDPSRFSETVGAIESIGRSTLVEMRRLLAVLRTRDAASAMPPHTLPTGHESVSGFVPGAERGSQEPPPTNRWSSRTRMLSDSVRRWFAIPWVADGALVLILAVLALTEPLFGLLPVPFWLSVVVVGVLLLRRRFPLVVLLVVTAVVFVMDAFLTGTPYTADRSLFLAVFTVAALRGPAWSIVAAGAPVIGYAPLIFRPGWLFPYDVAGFSSFFLFAVIGGLAVRNATRLNAELRDQSELLRRTREERVRLAVDEERTRIARDVHDLVAHGVTLMVIQAGAARWLAESDPFQADQALSAVEQAGQEALGELHSLVGSLDGMPTASQPLPTDEQLTIRSLVEHEIEAGMHVELVIVGEPRELDAGLELSLFRIVQEALTNVRKHAPGAKAWVGLRYTPEGVEVEVTDSGGGTLVGSSTVPGAGHGLVGIAERAGLFGGRAEAGPTPEGGFRVRATLHEERVLV